MPHLYQHHSTQSQHPAGYHGAVPPQTAAGAPAPLGAPQPPLPPAQQQQQQQHMLAPPHGPGTQQAQHPQITPPHPYSTNPYGVSTAAAVAAPAPGSAAAPMGMHPHHAAAYQAGFASAHAHAAQHAASLQAAQAQAQHAQVHAMYGFPAGHHHHHLHHLPYRPSAVPPSTLAGKDTAGTSIISPGIKREDSGDIENNDGRASAEDIAVSALSMLCGAALGDVKVKKEEEGTTAASSEQKSAVPVEGSPSFVEEAKKQTTDANDASAAANTATATAAAAAHISPVSTVGSTGAEGTPADGAKQVVLVDPAAAAGADASAPTGKPMPHFPSFLHDVLTNSRHAGSVLEWLPHGQGWRVLRWDEMARSVLPEHFPQFCTSSAPKEEDDATGSATDNNKEEKEDAAAAKTEGDGNSDAEPKARVTPKADEDSPKGAGGDVNAFLAHVRAWGFQEVRDGGPDMGSYRHAVSFEAERHIMINLRIALLDILLTDLLICTPFTFDNFAALPSRQPEPEPSNAPSKRTASLRTIGSVNGHHGCAHRIATSAVTPQLGILRIHGRQAQDWSDRIERLARIAIDQARSIRFHALPATATDAPS